VGSVKIRHNNKKEVQHMQNNYPNPDAKAPGIQMSVASASDFTGVEPSADINDDVAKGARQAYPYLQAHLTAEMKKRLKRDQL